MYFKSSLVAAWGRRPPWREMRCKRVYYTTVARAPTPPPRSLYSKRDRRHLTTPPRTAKRCYYYCCTTSAAAMQRSRMVRGKRNGGWWSRAGAQSMKRHSRRRRRRLYSYKTTENRVTGILSFRLINYFPILYFVYYRWAFVMRRRAADLLQNCDNTRRDWRHTRFSRVFRGEGARVLRVQRTISAICRLKCARENLLVSVFWGTGSTPPPNLDEIGPTRLIRRRFVTGNEIVLLLLLLL